jgi:hypothetical protein
MMFATALRWLGLDEPPHASTVELMCGGRVSLSQDSDGNAALSVTTAPDTNGQTHAVAVPLSFAERAEIQQALDVGSHPSHRGATPEYGGA